MTKDDQIEIATAVMSQHTHRWSRRLMYLFTGEIDTTPCDVCRKRMVRAFEELERSGLLPTGRPTE